MNHDQKYLVSTEYILLIVSVFVQDPQLVAKICDGKLAALFHKASDVLIKNDTDDHTLVISLLSWPSFSDIWKRFGKYIFVFSDII